MKLLFENWRQYLTEGEERVYTVVHDDGNALYFEDDIVRELKDYNSPFMQELNQAMYDKAGFTYARRLAQKPDGSTEPSDQPVFYITEISGMLTYLKI